MSDTTEPDDLTDRLGHTYPAVLDYPVSLALWHWNRNGVPTPVSGDTSKTWEPSA